ncbi:MAG: hypothetical protein R3F43_13495 [bacterium]
MKRTSRKVVAGLCLLAAQAAHGRGEVRVADGAGGAGGGLVAEGAGGSGGVQALDLSGKGGDTSRFGEGPVSPYYDLTPICNYLERGLDDQQPGFRDGYVLQPPGIETLADIDRIAFGLDLPATHCSDNPRSIPCSADTDPKSWCIERVELELLGMKLVDLSAPTNTCLLTAHGGTQEAGIVGLSHLALRSLPTWGLSDADLERLLGSLGRGADGQPTFLPRQLVLPGEYLGRTLEGVVGQVLTKDAIGCNNELYCGHRPKRPGGAFGAPTIRLANSAEVDCDLGSCAATSARKSSPWVEVAGEVVGGTPTLHFDVDFAAERDRLLSSDCSSLEPGAVTSICAVEKEMMAHGSLELDVAVRCLPFAHVTFEVDGHEINRRLPYCDGGNDKCFQPGVNKHNEHRDLSGAPRGWPGGQRGRSRVWRPCQPGSGDVRSGHGGGGSAARHRRGCGLNWAGELLCGAFGCDFDALATSLLGGMLPDLDAVSGGAAVHGAGGVSGGGGGTEQDPDPERKRMVPAARAARCRTARG